MCMYIHVYVCVCVCLCVCMCVTALNPLAEESVRHTGNIGSHFYMGPEQAAGKKYDQKVDIYSLGVIYFELHFPFDTEMERVKVRTCRARAAFGGGGGFPPR